MKLYTKLEQPDYSNQLVPRTIFSHTALRGIAAIFVVIAHLDLLDWFVGAGFITTFAFRWHAQCVDLFFILSGFILNHVYSNSDKISWKKFYKARIGRIFPLYYLTLFFMIALDVVWSQFFGRETGRLDFLYILQNLFMLSGWMGLDIEGPLGGTAYNSPAWSVSVEVFLYFAIFPLLFLTQRKVKGLFTHLALIGSFAFGVSCVYLFDLPDRYYFITRGICGFTAGFYIRSLMRHYSFPRPFVRFIGIFGLLLTAVAIPAYIPRGTLPLWFALIVFATAYDSGPFCKTLKNGLFQYLGDRSYSIYLWHLPLLELIRLFFLGNDIAASFDHSFALKVSMFGTFGIALFIVSELSYRYFECPMRNLIRKL